MKMFTPARIDVYILPLLILLGCGGCGKSGGVNEKNVTTTDITTIADTTAPTISLQYPAADATGVATNSSITATFSEPMDLSSITSSSFLLTQNENSVSGSVSLSGTVATFTPGSNFLGNTTYTATITTSAKDTAGNPLAANFSWSFTTGAAPDTTPPTVTSTTPATGTNLGGASAPISVSFSEPILPSSVNTATFIVNNGSSNISGTLSCSAATATFTPSVSLAYNTQYTVTITTGIKDLADNPLATPYTWNFTLIPAILSWQAPTTRANDTPLAPSDIGGYKIYYGITSGAYSDMIDVGNVTTYPFPNSNFSSGTYFFAVTAYDLTGLESDFSNEVSKNIQ